MFREPINGLSTFSSTKTPHGAGQGARNSYELLPALEGICSLLEATMALFARVGHTDAELTVLASVNVATSRADAYMSQDGKDDPFLPVLRNRSRDKSVWIPPCGPSDTDASCHRFRTSWLEPQGLEHLIYGVVDVQTAGASYVLLGRPNGAGAFCDTDASSLQAVLPSLRFAYRALQQPAHWIKDPLLYVSLLNELPIGVAILDQRHRPVFLNRYFKHMFKSDRALSGLRERLREPRKVERVHTDQDDQNPLLNESAAQCWIVSLHSSSANRPLPAIVQRLKPEFSVHDGDGPAYFVIANDPDLGIEPRNEALCRLYGLTPAEGRLTALIASGNQVQSSAELLGVSVSTVRTHLKHVFSKTETSSQAELIRLLITLPALFLLD